MPVSVIVKSFCGVSVLQILLKVVTIHC